ncbi:MAG: transcriptional regulator, TetR family [Solirubrobacterales bacterium]|nr:transcriptional regulator, TetR family [Solirubrobacterales bacterium]
MKPTRPVLPREFVAVRKRRRIMDAMAELSAEQGYEATKIADIVRRAGVARKTLYDNFDGKEEVFLAAFDSGLVEVSTQIEEACASADPGWADRLAAGLRAFLAYIAENPAAARMCLIEAMSATPAASARYDDAMEKFVELLRRSAPAETGLPDTIEETVVGGVAWVLHQQIRRSGAEQALDLMPELLDFILSPYHGVANSGGNR